MRMTAAALALILLSFLLSRDVSFPMALATSTLALGTLYATMRMAKALPQFMRELRENCSGPPAMFISMAILAAWPIGAWIAEGWQTGLGIFAFLYIGISASIGLGTFAES